MSTPTNPMFGRKYSLQVFGQASGGQRPVITITDSAFEPEALRIVFDIQTVWYSWYWTAHIVIYNPNEQLTNFLLSQGGTQSTATSVPNSNVNPQNSPVIQGMEVVLSAGYQNGKYDVIWDGYVLQPMFERENQTDFKVTLNCVIGLTQDTRNSLGRNYAAGTSQLQIVRDMAKNSFHPISITPDSISPALNKKLPRAKVMFGTPGQGFDQIARDNNMQWWLSSKGVLNMASLDQTLPTTAQVYTPTTGIVGTPQQTQWGVDVRLLLDPTVQVRNPPMAIKIDNTVIRQLQKQIGDAPSAVSMLSQDGTYVVVGVRYVGDTRGQEWYTMVTGYLMAKDKLAALSAGTGVPLFSGS